jgi:hypothetical protein
MVIILVVLNGFLLRQNLNCESVEEVRTGSAQGDRQIRVILCIRCENIAVDLVVATISMNQIRPPTLAAVVHCGNHLAPHTAN